MPKPKNLPARMLFCATASAALLFAASLATNPPKDVADNKGTLANSDPNYRALRNAAPEESFHVENLRIVRDAGEFTFKDGTFTLTPSVLGKKTLAMFNGEGEFRIAPQLRLERDYLISLTGKDAVAETFGKLVLCTTDGTAEEIRSAGKSVTLDARGRDLLKDFRNRVRDRNEHPRSMMEAMFRDDEMENVEAELLADLYNPARSGTFGAFIFGRKYGDLRFIVRPQGAIPDLGAEEVALINLDPEADHEGILYFAHRLDEYKGQTANSQEDKRTVTAEHYTIETVIGGNEHLTSVARVRVRGVTGGDRVIRFGLLPNLRVSRVTLGDREIPFIQEDRKQDGSFYVVLPEPLRKDQKYEIAMEYQGDKVIEKAGGGSFAVGARTSWYPSLNAFRDQATYDLTFKVPKKYTLVSVGDPVKQETEDKLAVSHWVSKVPLAVAGFNYGEFKQKQLVDEATKYTIEGYATRELPDYLRMSESLAAASPSTLVQNTLSETQVSLRIYKDWFGPAPYGRIAITQQPEFNFGQSWPGLVYLPLSAYLDATQRWMLMGQISQGLTDFIQEVTPHEVAHQWWGHMVGWSSMHDQWLSEGFADFSAGVYLQLTEKKRDKYFKYLDRSRDMILDKNKFGRRPNDAGPLWMGLRLSTRRNAGAYQQLVYPKGGYILHMLRMMMLDPKTGEANFKKMMRDYVSTHLHKSASTESFIDVVERHMTPVMNVTGNNKMDWFFSEWVYGTDVPRYTLDYNVAPQDGKFLLTAKLTQSEVTERFAMVVPIYIEFNSGAVTRLGTVTMFGNSSQDKISVVLPEKPKRVLVNYFRDVLEQK